MISRLERILSLVKENPVEFRRFSRDKQQPNPEARVASISNILSEISLPGNSTVVDIGTGYGYGAVLLNALGYNVIGLEINGDKLDEGMRYWARLGIEFREISEASEAVKTKGRLYLLKRDSRNLDDFPALSVGMVTAFYISTYMLGRDGAFVGVNRILKPDGSLTITTEGPTFVPSLFRGLIVRKAGRFFVPNLKLAKAFDIDGPQVYDRCVLIYEKAA